MLRHAAVCKSQVINRVKHKHRDSAFEVVSCPSGEFTRGLFDCWPWTGRLHRDGYGQYVSGVRLLTASRVACELAHGASDLEACHTCDHPACCNPAHLYWGTHQDNMDDRARRNRAARGERNGRAKLTADQVREIRARGGSVRGLAREFGIDPHTVRDIRRGKIWAHV